MIIARHWKPIKYNGKDFVAFEKWNLEDPNDSLTNGIYVYSAPSGDFNYTDILDSPNTQKVQTTKNPTVKLDVDAMDTTVGVSWVENEGTRYLIHLSETFYGGKNEFVLCTKPTILAGATEMIDLDLRITKDKVGMYEYVIYYTWLHKDSSEPLGGLRRHCTYGETEIYPEK